MELVEFISKDELKKNIRQQLRYVQIANDEINHPEHNKNDNIRCIVCNGRYMRNQRCTHLSVKKHKKALDAYYEKYIK